jgi:hypothetical protein
MGDRHHLHSHDRALVVSVRRVGFVFRPGRRLVDEPTSGPAAGGPSGANGLVAATCAYPSHSALGSGLPIYLGGIPTVSGGSPRDLQHECGRQLCDNAAAESFFGVLKRERVNRQQYRTRAEAKADIFDYIERCYNPRQRRRLDL